MTTTYEPTSDWNGGHTTDYDAASEPRSQGAASSPRRKAGKPEWVKLLEDTRTRLLVAAHLHDQVLAQRATAATAEGAEVTSFGYLADQLDDVVRALRAG